MLKKLLYTLTIISVFSLLVGCGASRKNHLERLMLQGADSLSALKMNFPDLDIKKGDLLTIQIFSANKEATALFNQQQGESTNVMGGGAGMASMGRGYLVDKDGFIYIHALGSIKAEGLTKSELSSVIVEGLKKWLTEPYVTVRFVNIRVNVLGEVTRPGIIDVPDQKFSVLDAIGMAGDFTQFSRRDNVLLVREENGKRLPIRLDFRNADLYKSPYFYLQQNDMIYVEPNRKKPTGNEQVLMRNIAIGTSILSVITLLVTLLIR